MTDYFALLTEPRRPLLDPDLLKEKFLALSTEAHPDRVHGAGDSERQRAEQRSAELNAAYQCLREPKTRLRHLLELERGSAPANLQRVPSPLMDLSMKVAGLCRDTDAFLAQKSAVTSPLLKVQLFEQGQDWTEKLMTLQKDMTGLEEQLNGELKAIDARWDSNSDAGERGALLQKLEELAGLYGYFSRWNAQIRERITQLAF